MKRAFLVAGPEASGNRFLARLLVDGGCIGDGAHHQRWDEIPPRDEEPIVWIRSLPHGGTWPDIAGLVSGLHKNGYVVQAVVPVRHPVAMARSQVGAGHVGSEPLAYVQARRGLALAFASFTALEVPWWVVPTESLTSAPACRALLLMLGLRVPGDTCELGRDENAKWWLPKEHG